MGRGTGVWGWLGVVILLRKAPQIPSSGLEKRETMWFLGPNVLSYPYKKADVIVTELGLCRFVYFRRYCFPKVRNLGGIVTANHLLFLLCVCIILCVFMCIFVIIHWTVGVGRM